MSKKILYAEDNPEIQDVLKQLLTAHFEVEIISFSNGVQALQYLREYAVDLIISDEQMPLMRGSRLLSELIKDRNFTPFFMHSTQAVPPFEIKHHPNFYSFDKPQTTELLEKIKSLNLIPAKTNASFKIIK